MATHRVAALYAERSIVRVGSPTLGAEHAVKPVSEIFKVALGDYGGLALVARAILPDAAARLM